MSLNLLRVSKNKCLKIYIGYDGKYLGTRNIVVPGVGRISEHWSKQANLRGLYNLACTTCKRKRGFSTISPKIFTSHFIFHVTIATDFENESITGEAPSPSAGLEKRLWSMLDAGIKQMWNLSNLYHQ